MTIEEINELNMADAFEYYRPSLERLRIILMLFMCINLFGLTSSFSGITKILCGFVPIAFFILSGYLVLRESPNRPKRIVRAIKRCAITFAILAVVYFIINLLFYSSQGISILPAMKSKRFWFNFLVLNIWQFDIGTAIWYVQALLYAYIIIYFLDKWNLLRHDWKIAAVLILLTVCTGELSGIIRWNIAGYTFIAGNFFTRALPYVLLGCFIHRKAELLACIRNVWYCCAIVAGFILILGEMFLLDHFGLSGYYSHLLGMPVVAAAMCIIAFNGSNKPGFEAELGMTRWGTNCIYYFCQPVSVLVILMISVLGTEALANAIGYISIITFLICFGIAWCVSYLNRTFFRKKANGRKNKTRRDPH